MPNSYRKPPRTPPGCEDHLTRQQAAQLLGFSSEFKIRQLEREGRLQSVRGPMRTAFYARADVLAVKAELARDGLGHEEADSWTDAELLLLLGSPNRLGRQRTALDLVLETRISIERAEKVFAFWAGSQVEATASAARTPPAPAATETARTAQPLPQAPMSAPASPAVPSSVAATGPGAAATRTVAEAKPASEDPRAPGASVERSVPQPALPRAVAAQTPSGASAKAAEQPQGLAPVAVQATRVESAQPTSSDESERRGEDRMSRDSLIAQLRDPDPRVRDRAFAHLKELQAGR